MPSAMNEKGFRLLQATNKPRAHWLALEAMHRRDAANTQVIMERFEAAKQAQKCSCEQCLFMLRDIEAGWK